MRAKFEYVGIRFKDLSARFIALLGKVAFSTIMKFFLLFNNSRIYGLNVTL